jgi:PQQ-dependent dehydrogenase (methanol/ethanol family)
MLTVSPAGRNGNGRPSQKSSEVRRWLPALMLSATIPLSIVTSSIAQTTSAANTGIATALANERAANEPVKPNDSDWPVPGRNYGGTRYADIDQINTQNVKDLKVAWTFSTGVNRGQEAPGIVVGKTMYVVTPFPNLLYALDLDKAVKGQTPIKWKYEPKPESAAQGVACCDLVNRGCAYEDGRIFFNTLDVQTCCVDAETGKEIWKVKLGSINKGESITMAPLVVHGKVYVGNSGGEFGVRGWLKCLDAKSGNVLWTAYSTGPDADCLIGSDFKPFYKMDQGTDLGVTTWPPDHWKLGGGTVWGWVTYDPETNQIFYGTANPGSWNPELRPGDNKWSATVFARDADTGQARWAYQYNPHDLFDHDEINEHIVLDLPLDGPDKPVRKVIVHPARNGYMYIIDRVTGQVLSATQYERNTCIKSIDLQTGRLIPNDEKHPQVGATIRDIQPASPGAKDWQPCAFSPRTGLLYMPHQNLACDYEAVEANYIEGTPYVGVNEKMYAGADDPDSLGYFTAWDLINQKVVWRIKEKFPCWSGALVTSGDVVFYGTMDGWFRALDAHSGQKLWEIRLGSGIVGQPTTFKGPDGKQYVSILSGVGGWAGAVVAGDLDIRDPTGALGFVNAMKELPKYTTKGGTLYVFGLP